MEGTYEFEQAKWEALEDLRIERLYQGDLEEIQQSMYDHPIPKDVHDSFMKQCDYGDLYDLEDTIPF